MDILSTLEELSAFGPLISQLLNQHDQETVALVNQLAQRAEAEIRSRQNRTGQTREEILADAQATWERDQTKAEKLKNLGHESSGEKGFVLFPFLIGMSIISMILIFTTITPSQTLALSIAGIVSTGLVWLVNRKLLPVSWGITDENGHLHGRWAFAVTILISFVVACVALYVSNDQDFLALIHGRDYGLDKLYRAGMVVLGTATIVFKFLFPQNTQTVTDTK